MKEFGYQRPDSVQAAVAAFAEHARIEGSRADGGQTDGGHAEGVRAPVAYLGGGTNLVDLMKLGVAQPSQLVDITGLDLDAIAETADGGVHIGAAVRNSDLAAHPLIRRRYPAVAQAVLAGASGQLRNLATLGGNLMQRTRCAYFTDVNKPCNKRNPGSGCPARGGEHHNLAVIGGSSHCIATSPSDLAVALVAFDAQVHLHEGGTDRTVALTEFRRLPGDFPEVETTAEPGALITGLTLPPSELAAGSHYRKVRERASYAFAIGSVAAALATADGVVTDCRIAYGAIAPVPWRAGLAEQYLKGKPATAEVFAAAADAELAVATPLPDNAYKLALIRNLTVDVLTELAGAQS